MITLKTLSEGDEMKAETKEEIAAARAASLRRMEELAELCKNSAFKCGPASLAFAASKIKKVSE